MEKELNNICEDKEMYENLIKLAVIMGDDMEGDFLQNVKWNTEKKTAIFIHYSIDDSKRIEEIKTRLITFCKEEMKTDNYEIFIEIGSFLKERPVFEEMLAKFKQKEYSNLVIANIGQIYKLSYDVQKAIDLSNEIKQMNINIICVDERKMIEGIDNGIK